MYLFNHLFKKNNAFGSLKHNDFFASRESGRTMTEMLGVLAIVGMLSIGGIAGYNYGMDKYRANVTINDINLRAVDLITQASQQQPLSLAEWSSTSTAGYTFDALGEEFGLAERSGFIYLQVSGVPKGVCEKVVDTLDERFEVEVKATRDEGDTSICGNNNSIRVYFEATGANTACNPACDSGKTCINGICLYDETIPVLPSNTVCSTNENCPECYLCSGGKCSDYTTLNGEKCRTNNSGTCNSGVCQYNKCSSNADCDADEFCADSNSSSISRTPNKCVSLNGYLTRKIITLSNGTKETWYLSSRTSWWDAESICKAAGLEMVKINELVTNWNGSMGTFTLNERGQKLATFFGGDIWTNNQATAHSAFHIYLNSGYAQGHLRHSYTFRSLCH